MFKAKISDVSLFVNSIATIGEIIDEGIFKLEKKGISLMAADRAMVAVVDFHLSSSAFDEYELDEEKEIGVDISNFLSVLKRAKGGDKLGFELKESKLEVIIENSGRRKFVVPLLELSPEEIPPIDQLEFSCKVEISPDIFISGINDAEVVADSVVFEATPTGFSMRAEGDVSSAELELKKGEEGLRHIEANGNISARYPIDYLTKMVKAARIADTLIMQWGQDYPIRLDFLAGDKCRISFVLAPRVAEE